MESNNLELKELTRSELLEVSGGEPCSVIIGVGILIGIAFSIWKNRRSEG